MPFVDLGDPQQTGASVGQQVSVQSPSDLNSQQPVSQLPDITMLQSSQVVTPQTVMDTNSNGDEQHELLEKAPEQIKEPVSQVIEIKGPPLPGQEPVQVQPSQPIPVQQVSVAQENPVQQVSAPVSTEPLTTQIPVEAPVVENPSSIANDIANAFSKSFESDISAISPVQQVAESQQVSVEAQPAPPLPTNIDMQNSISGASSLPPLSSILGEAQQSKEQGNIIKDMGIKETQQEPKPAKPINVARILATFNPQTASMEEYMAYTISSKASDLHIVSQNQSFMRVDGHLQPIPGEAVSAKRVEELINEIVPKDLLPKLKEAKEIDFSVEHSSGDRFRVNIFHKTGTLSAALRLIPREIKSISELGLPEIIYEFTKVPHGLVLVTGPTGSGKSTTIASMINEINLNRTEHIITIEDPIEYIFPKRKSLIEQREIGRDSNTWTNALRAILRQDPNIVLVGEMRDYETIESTVTIAETGHLVFATLHTNSAAQTIDRIIDVFPEGQQSQIRAQLANVLTAVVAQRLVPVKSGGRRAVQEILIATSAIKNAIRENKTYQIDNIIQTSQELGMATLEGSLMKLVKEGEVTIEEAQNYTIKPDELLSLLKGTK